MHASKQLCGKTKQCAADIFFISHVTTACVWRRWVTQLWDMFEQCQITVNSHSHICLSRLSASSGMSCMMARISKSISLPKIIRRRLSPVRCMQDVPPYNFHGSLDDSLQNLRKVVPVPPRRDYVKYMDNIGKLLRYEAQLVNVAFYQSLSNCSHSGFIVACRLNRQSFSPRERMRGRSWES